MGLMCSPGSWRKTKLPLRYLPKGVLVLHLIVCGIGILCTSLHHTRHLVFPFITFSWLAWTLIFLVQNVVFRSSIFFFCSHSFPGSGVVTCTQGFNEHMNNSYPFLLLLGVSSLLLFHSEGDATLIIALQCFECLKIACIMATSLICGIVLWVAVIPTPTCLPSFSVVLANPPCSGAQIETAVHLHDKSSVIPHIYCT